MIRAARLAQQQHVTTAAATAAGLLGLLVLRDRTRAEESASSSSSSRSRTAKERGLIEVDLMDRIASKPYVNYHNTYSPSSAGVVRRSSENIVSKFRRGGGAASSSSSAEGAQLSDYDEYEDAGRWDGGEVGGDGGWGRGRRRPRGVPRRVRVLAIDVPEFREVFDGECRVNLSRVFPDDIAPPKRIRRKARPNSNSDSSSSGDGDDDKGKARAKGAKQKKNRNKGNGDDEAEQQHLEVIQKSLARSLVRCRNRESKRIGVEVLEASVYDLNPHNMRRTYQFGGYRYDPGKYATMRSKPGNRKMSGKKQGKAAASAAAAASDEKGAAEADEVEEDEYDEAAGPADAFEDEEEDEADSAAESTSQRKGKNERSRAPVAPTEEDELDAPWNQYAWIEEMQLRIAGLVPFGAPVGRSSLWSRYVFGDVYKRTVPSCRSYFGRFLPAFLTGEMFGDDGIDGDYVRRGGGGDGRTPNRASAKPHAVIADGAAMQRVPGSLRHLTKCCREADVPLFIVNDPRVWGGNTHSDLESAAADMRRVIKARVVVNALNIKEGSMFERGRLLGKLETEARWQAKDAGRRTRQAVRDAQSRLRKEREDDWSKLEGDELHERLIARKVIAVEKNGGSDADGERESYTKGMINLCSRSLESVKRKSTGFSSSEEEDKSINEKVEVGTLPGHGDEGANKESYAPGHVGASA